MHPRGMVTRPSVITQVPWPVILQKGRSALGRPEPIAAEPVLRPPR